MSEPQYEFPLLKVVGAGTSTQDVDLEILRISEDEVSFEIILSFGTDKIKAKFESVLDYFSIGGKVTIRPDHMIRAAKEGINDSLAGVLEYLIAKHATLHVVFEDDRSVFLSLVSEKLALRFEQHFNDPDLRAVLRNEECAPA